MNEIEMLIQLEYLKLGLIPPSVDVDKALNMLDPRPAYKARRKFRKIYRKALKYCYNTKQGYYEVYGGISHKPTPEQKSNRKRLVYEYISRKVIRYC